MVKGVVQHFALALVTRRAFVLDWSAWKFPVDRYIRTPCFEWDGEVFKPKNNFFFAPSPSRSCQ